MQKPLTGKHVPFKNNTENTAGTLKKFVALADCYATLRDFIEKFDPKKISKKKFQKKNFKKFSVKFFFQNFFGYRCSAANFGYACKKFGV
jgi:hypothetical protein